MYVIEGWLSGVLINFMGNVLLLIFQGPTVESFYKQADYYNIKKLPKIEFEHAPTMYTTELPRNISGSDVLVMDPEYTPDFRIEEPPFTRFHHSFLDEEERPYRISPHYKQIRRFSGHELDQTGCTCVTVYKRFHLLAVCCVITTRHIITTATSTEIVLRRRRHFKYLEDILGFWYDYSANEYNSSLYAAPARIHYHPRYLRPKMVNRSHPFPVVFDIAIWAATHRFYTAALFGSAVVICKRGGSHRYEHAAAAPVPGSREDKRSFIVGWQFMKAFKRVPMPWFKYLVITKKHVWPCPKVEWGWFHCVRGNWAKLGLDSGAPLFRMLRKSWRYDGLVGINIISMRLRSFDMLHYFQILESHTVLDFLYESMMGMLPYEWLDDRFHNTRGRSPAPKNDTFVYLNYTFGVETYYSELPNY